MREFDEVEIVERAAVLAFQLGCATRDNINELSMCRNMLALGAMKRGDQTSLTVAAGALATILTIRKRAEETGKFRAEKWELKILELLVEQSASFWPRQSGKLFIECYESL